MSQHSDFFLQPPAPAQELPSKRQRVDAPASSPASSSSAASSSAAPDEQDRPEPPPLDEPTWLPTHRVGDLVFVSELTTFYNNREAGVAVVTSAKPYVESYVGPGSNCYRHVCPVFRARMSHSSGSAPLRRAGPCSPH